MPEPVSEQIRRAEVGGILTLTLIRERKLNAVSQEALKVIRKAVTDLAEDESLRALVIMAEGRYFTSGRDIGEFGPQESQSGIATRYRNYRALTDLFDDIERVEKPVILAAQGPCLGLGVEMAASCDFRLAGERATFGLPEIANLAVLPGSGGVSRLTRVVGPHWARWLVMAGENVTAEEALRIGFVHKVFPDDGFAGAVLDWTRRLVGFSAEALGLAKIAIDAAASGDLRTARQIDAMANSQLAHTREHVAKIQEFQGRSKRPR